MQGQQGTENTGIYDRRAGYSYLGALASLLMGHYQSFVALNVLAWLGAVLAMYWLGGRLLGSRLAAWTAGTLTATGQGFSFMVGTPVSTLLGFASVALILAFVEWSGVLQPPFRWRDWLHTGWLIAAVSLIYPVYLALLAFVWSYGLRQAPFTRLLGLSALVLGLAQVWPLIGTTVVGLEFDTLNSAQLASALNLWWSALLHGPSVFLDTLRTVAGAGTIYARVPWRDALGRCVWLRRGRAAGAPMDARPVPRHMPGVSRVRHHLRYSSHGLLCISGDLPAGSRQSEPSDPSDGELASVGSWFNADARRVVSSRHHARAAAAGSAERDSAGRLWGR